MGEISQLRSKFFKQPNKQNRKVCKRSAVFRSRDITQAITNEDAPEGFQGVGFNPNPKPFRGGGGVLKPETRKGFRLGLKEG